MQPKGAPLFLVCMTMLVCNFNVSCNPWCRPASHQYYIHVKFIYATCAYRYLWCRPASHQYYIHVSMLHARIDSSHLNPSSIAKPGSLPINRASFAFTDTPASLHLSFSSSPTTSPSLPLPQSQVVRVKDRVTEPMINGYRDVLCNVMIAGCDELILEIQLHFEVRQK